MHVCMYMRLDITLHTTVAHSDSPTFWHGAVGQSEPWVPYFKA